MKTLERSVNIVFSFIDKSNKYFMFDLSKMQYTSLLLKSIDRIRYFINNYNVTNNILCEKYKSKAFSKIQKIRNQLTNKECTVELAWALHEIINNPKYKKKWHALFSTIITSTQQ